MGVNNLDTILVEHDGIIDDTTIIVVIVVAIMKNRTKIDFDLQQWW